MSPNARRALFYSLFLLFIILGIGISLYAQGWRIDFQSFRVNKIGGIYVRSYPEDAQIFLNGKPFENQSGFLSRGTLITDLFPKSYRLTLTAPGYLDWHEDANVLPAFVVNHKYAVLVPHNGISFSSTTARSVMQSRNTIVLETSLNVITRNNDTIGIGKLETTTDDLQALIFQTARGSYRFWSTTNNTTTNLIASGTLSIDPTNHDQVISADSQNITIVDALTGTTSRVGKAGTNKTIARSIAISGSLIAWAADATKTNSSSITLYDRSLRTSRDDRIAMESHVQQLAWVTNDILGILTEDGKFYLYDINQRNLKKTADDVTVFSATSDGTRVAALEKKSLEIFSLNDPDDYHRFNLPNGANVERTIWYRDNDHLFVVYPDRIAFLDLQDAGLSNFAIISFGTAPQYDPTSNTLSLIDSRGMPLHFDFAK